MTAESTFRGRVLTGIRGEGGHAVPVENAVESGTPDLNYCVLAASGWLELKVLERWPRQIDTKIRVEHYTMQQRKWIHDRQEAGGRAGLLIQIEHDILLYMDKTAVVIGSLDKEQMFLRATGHWYRTINWQEFTARIAA